MKTSLTEFVVVNTTQCVDDDNDPPSIFSFIFPILSLIVYSNLFSHLNGSNKLIVKGDYTTITMH